jgi:hypothetical protein
LNGSSRHTCKLHPVGHSYQNKIDQTVLFWNILVSTALFKISKWDLYWGLRYGFHGHTVTFYLFISKIICFFEPVAQLW